MGRFINYTDLQMKKLSLLNTIPNSKHNQNPVFTSDEFFKYCKNRFANIGTSKEDFFWLLNFYRKEGFLLPVYSENGVDCYSSFQVYNLYLLETHRSYCLKPDAGTKYKGKTIKFPKLSWQEILKNKINSDILKVQIDDFNKVLLLLLKIQDYYLPEIRGNKRIGEWQDYKGTVVRGGTCFVTISNFILSSIRKWRTNLIMNGKFNPQRILSDSKLEVETIKNWTIKLAGILKDVDPLVEWRWHLFVTYIDYNKRQKLKGDALLAEDFYEMVNILFLFLKDLGEDLLDKGISDVFDWFDLSPRDEKSKLPHWKERDYGKEALNNPYQMLEFLSNRFGVNPKPKAIIFTEGDEWKAISKLFEFYELNPNLLGIEFRSICGEGNFSLKNWQCFIEYMHEKQVLVYFVLDNEGQVAKEAKKLLKAKRKFNFPGLKKVIPTRYRIKIWGVNKGNASFEEANFTDKEISLAVKLHTNQEIPTKEIKNIRNDPKRKKGLIGAIEDKFKIGLDKNKPLLDMLLVDNIIKKRRHNTNVKKRTPLENFVLKTGEMVLSNYQPTGKYHQNENFKTRSYG